MRFKLKPRQQFSVKLNDREAACLLASLVTLRQQVIKGGNDLARGSDAVKILSDIEKRLYDSMKKRTALPSYELISKRADQLTNKYMSKRPSVESGVEFK